MKESHAKRLRRKKKRFHKRKYLTSQSRKRIISRLTSLYQSGRKFLNAKLTTRKVRPKICPSERRNSY
jgi:hypothetical protein